MSDDLWTGDGSNVNTHLNIQLRSPGDDDPTQCNFSLPPLQSRLEKLMGSNVVRLTDRTYMLSLRRRIQEEYEESVRRRIASREQAEIDRQKKLILDGKMPFSDAPSELANHPVFKITQITHQMLDEKKLKSKRVKRSTHHSHGSDHRTPSSQRLTVESSARRSSSCPAGSEGDSPSADTDSGGGGGKERSAGGEAGTEGESLEPTEFVFTQEQFDRLRYETESVKYLRGLETVDEIYEVAGRIVGKLQLHNVEAEPVVGCTTLGINLS